MDLLAARKKRDAMAAVEGVVCRHETSGEDCVMGQHEPAPIEGPAFERMKQMVEKCLEFKMAADRAVNLLRSGKSCAAGRAWLRAELDRMEGGE